MGLFKGSMKIEGDIGYHGLTEWWLNELTKDERTKLVFAVKIIPKMFIKYQ